MLSNDQRNVEKIVKKSATSFYWGMKCLPEEKKRAMFSVYAFCRIVDDIADNKASKNSKKKKLSEWKTKINNLFLNKNYKNSVLRELKNSILHYGLEKKDFISIIDGMSMDIDKNIRFPKIKELNLYCERVAVAVGYLSIKIFGLHCKTGKEYAHSLGMAFQLTNIVRDFREDLDINRCYIPYEIQKKYGLSPNLKDLEKNIKIQDVLQEILNDADVFFKKSEKLSKKLEKKKIIASEIMKLFYKKIHLKMFKKKINFQSKVKLNFFDKISILGYLIFR